MARSSLELASMLIANVWPVRSRGTLLSLQQCGDLCRRMSAAELARACSHGFLLQRPTLTAEPEPIEYQTEPLARLCPLRDRKSTPTPWALAPILKRPGNPFPDHITIGRALNCDVVVRESFVSKLHARLLASDDGTLLVVDCGSANRTRVNDVVVGDEPASLNVGDRLQLGSRTLQRVSAEAVHELVAHLG